MHLSADSLHGLRHVSGHMRCSMRRKREHPKPLFRDRPCGVEFAVGKRILYLRDSEEVITHISQHMPLHHFRQRHQFPEIDILG